MIKQKILSLLVALFATIALWASNVITYTATGQLSGYYGSLNVGKTTFGPAITSHTFSNGTGTITCSGEITTIGDYAFYGCSSLTSVTIPNSVTEIGNYVFYGCSGLTSITIPNSVTEIGNYVFYGCSGLTSITIPNSVTTIGDEAFSRCSGLTSITIPNSVTEIGNYVFYGCSGLTSVTIPNSVTKIGDWAFYDCSGLTSVTIPNSVTTIGSTAFLNVNNIVYSGTATGSPWGAKCVNGYVDGYLVYSDNTKTTLCGCSTAATGEITIPNSVTTIGDEAFSRCSGLTSITIPNSVTTIGDEAFYYCIGLKKTNFTGTISDWCKIAFETGDANPMSYSHNFFINDVEIKDLAIPEGVNTIGNYVFYGCSGLTSITIPNSVTTIGDVAFWGCSGLTSVTLPKTITSLGKSAFSRCGFTSIAIPFNTKSIGQYAFLGCPLKKIYIPYDAYIGNRAFYRNDDVDGYYSDTVCVMFSPFVSSDLSRMKDQFKYGKYDYIERRTKYYYPPMYAIPYGASSSVSPTGFEINVDLSEIKISGRDTLSLDLMDPEKEFILQANTQNNITIYNLKPNTEYNFQFFSRDTKTGQWIDGCSWNISTSLLEFTTLVPKVVSAGTAVVAAETNISDYETNVGFEWRRSDAPATMPSKSGVAIICNGVIEGKLLNLGTDSYWDVRPYYEAEDGTRFYGEWITFHPNDFSYFEPTVHTYALATSPTANRVQVRGYVMTGTDDVTEQGFEYWFKGSDKLPRRMPSATSDSIYRVQASGQVMTAVLEDLAYSTTYTCRAYAIAGGKTYYGEEVQFLTPEDPRPLYTLTISADENGSVNTDVSGQYREGETVPLTAIAEDGFRFMQWSDGNTDNPRQLTITANTELVAFFELADGLEGLTIDDAQCTMKKMIIDNQLFIFRGNELYNVSGQKVK